MDREEIPRSRAARAAAEAALVRVVHHYGRRPEFVVLGGLVPELLCTKGALQHAGTTDIDVQVDLEIACSSVNTRHLELALQNAEFSPDSERVWRWTTEIDDHKMLIKFELLSDLDDKPANADVHFDDCEALGAANLRGTGYASRDYKVVKLTSKVRGDRYTVEVNVTGLAGFLLAKTAAAHSRGKPKDWYDIAFVLLHNDEGGPAAAIAAVHGAFGSLEAGMLTSLRELRANFAAPDAQGTQAYVSQVLVDYPGSDPVQLTADALQAVEIFGNGLLDG